MILKYEFAKKIKKSKNEIIVLAPEDSLKYKDKKIDSLVRSKVLVYNDFSQVVIFCGLKSTPEENRRLGAQVFNSVKQLGISEVAFKGRFNSCLLYTSPSPRDA